MSTEPGLGPLLSPSPRGWIVCQSLTSPAPPLSPPQPPPHTAARGAGSHCWELKEPAPGSGPPMELLPAMKFPFPRPAHPVRGEACLPCQLSSWLFPQLCFPHAPSPFPFLQYSGRVAMGPADSLEGQNPFAPPLPCGGWGTGTVAGQRDVGGLDRGESPPLDTVCSASVPPVSKYLHGLFLRGRGIYVSDWFKPLNPTN